MSDKPNPPHAFTKLYHPQGPLVSFPILDLTPAGALAAVTAYLDAGWLVQAPGLDEGEEKEMVGWVLRSFIEQQGEVTPFVLLYPADQALKFSVLKVYLNTEDEIRAFEHASRLVLGHLPEYVADNKPERGKSAQLDKFIVPAPRPFGVVLRKNPKHDPAETDIKKKKPARLFVRWADAAAAPKAGAGGRPAGPIVGGVERLNDAELAELDAAIRDARVALKSFLDHYKIDRLDDLPAAALADALAKLRAKNCPPRRPEGMVPV